MPGLPFFICTGTVHTSSAPASEQRSTASGTSSGGCRRGSLPAGRPTMWRAAASAACPSTHPQDVRPVGELARAGAVADRRERERGQLAPAVGGDRDDRRAGRRDQLVPGIGADERRTAEERERRRPRYRDRSVRRPGEAACERQRRAHQPLDAEGIQQHEGAADVDQRVEAAELVQVHLGAGRAPWIDAPRRRRSSTARRSIARARPTADRPPRPSRATPRRDRPVTGSVSITWTWVAPIRPAAHARPRSRRDHPGRMPRPAPRAPRPAHPRP